MELRTISSFTTFIVEGKVSCTGVASTNTTSGSYASSWTLGTIALHVLFQGKCHVRLRDVWRGQKADRLSVQREMTELMELYDVPPLQAGG